MEPDSQFLSAFRRRKEDVPHMRNNWLCYDFKGRRITPTDCAIRSRRDPNRGHQIGHLVYDNLPGHEHLKFWLVDISVNGEYWHVVDLMTRRTSTLTGLQ
jgi:hypothetical protein